MPENNAKNRFLRFSSVGIQMGLIIVGGALFGNYLDDKNEKPIWTIVFSLLGIAIGLYLVIKEVLNLGKENDKKD